ncbi:MAG: RagB/SusD family nutrient uptake outer membrane protein, partial [Duncaniella sp.]|nr:RagB/SusD family nutrient uptake outer membrane protein [Duncaniella sp.]
PAIPRQRQMCLRDRDIPVFHVSDMYLVAAEAYLMAGNEAQALAKVNDVRNRAKAGALSSFGAYEASYVGITNVPFTVTPLDVILDERGRELYAERTRYEDLRRTKQLIRYNLAFSRIITSPSQMQNPKGEYKWLRPIPANEINFNTSMTLEDQNPGY